MSEALSAALEDLRAHSDKENQDIDAYLFDHRARKRARLSDADLKTQLEEEFLKPSYKFGPEWLNRLQS